MGRCGVPFFMCEGKAKLKGLMGAFGQERSFSLIAANVWFLAKTSRLLSIPATESPRPQCIYGIQGDSSYAKKPVVKDAMVVGRGKYV